MKKELFNDLLQSLKEAKAIQRGELKPGRVFRLTPVKARALIRSGRDLPEATARDEARVQEAIATVRTLKTSKAGKNVKRFGNKKELYADLGW